MKKFLKKSPEKKGFNLLGIVLAGLLALLAIINNFTVYPFAILFKTLTANSAEQGNIGPYEEKIKDIAVSELIEVKVDQYPSAGITFYSPETDRSKLPLVVLIHGGGWMIGDARSIQSYGKLLASNGYIVANVDYSLSPRYKYPVSTIQIVEIINHLYENADLYNIDTSKIFICGNSAGAHLTSQIGALLSSEAYAAEVGADVRVPNESIRGVILFNGVYNFRTVGSSGFPMVKELAWAYSGVKKYNEHKLVDEMSPINHVTEHYPATFITVGDADPLESQTYEFIQALEDNNIDYTSLLWTDTGAGLHHDYVYELQTEEGRQAYTDVVEFLEAHLD